MYDDLTDDELQACLLSEGIVIDALLAPDDDWAKAQTIYVDVRDGIYLRQCLNQENIKDDIY